MRKVLLFVLTLVISLAACGKLLGSEDSDSNAVDAEPSITVNVEKSSPKVSVMPAAESPNPEPIQKPLLSPTEAPPVSEEPLKSETGDNNVEQAAPSAASRVEDNAPEVSEIPAAESPSSEPSWEPLPLTPETPPISEEEPERSFPKQTDANPSVTVPVEEETEGYLVWVPTNGGTKYHRNSNCSKMKDPIQVSVETAEANGYTPCKRCW